MKKILKSSTVLSALMAVSQVAQAHPGHDHSHWASNSIHLLTVFAVAAVAVVGIVYKKIVIKTAQKKESKYDSSSY
ncbi:hypothetical protein [Psychromonas sp. GE-S-Ul-11]|uniref:hypothetical protein n=1 Tax=Psychromonas sp. GE-S-Ul-11 TaxID=3241170 RepID=UPI003AABDE67